MNQFFTKCKHLGLLSIFSLIAGQAVAQNQTDSLSNPGIQSRDVKVLFKTQPASGRLQSLSSVNGGVLEKSPVFYLNNMLYGRLTGLAVTQNSGEPGSGQASLSLRGQSPLVLVDGIPRDINAVDPEQIESVTVLKDALSTAMLGIRGGNGAILITTRKGSELGNKVSFSAQTGIQQPLSIPKGLDAYNYALLYNEALANDGRPLAYTQADLNAYRDHTDPLGHPNINWRDLLLRKESKFSRYHLSVDGTGSNYRYFVSLDHLDQQGIFNQEDINAYSTNSGYKRYNLRGNLEVDINKKLTASLNVFGRIQDENEPGATTPSLISNIFNTPNSAYPVLNANGSLAGNAAYPNNLYGQLYYSGYRQGYTRDGGVDISLQRKLDDVLKGLWLKAKASFYGTLSQSTNRSRTFEVFQLIDGPSSTYNRYGTRTDQSNTSSTDLWSQQSYAELAAGYQHDFAAHHIDVNLIANAQNFRVSPSELQQVYKTLGANFVYNYNNTYFFEFVGAYSGNNRLPKGKQAGFFPAVGLGWDLAQSSFLKGNVDFLQKLKLRASYGTAGNANAGYYVYNQYFAAATGYVISSTAGGVSGMAEATLANPNITWEKVNKLNIGLDVQFAHNTAYLSLDYFNNKLYDLLQVKGQSSAIIGNNYQLQNLRVRRLKGWEAEIGANKKIGKFGFNAALNFSLLNDKAIYLDEVTKPYAWMNRTGQPTGQIFGLIADGFYQNQQDIYTSAKLDGTNPVPGDIKYRDLNKDGVINVFDETALATTKPRLMAALSLGGKYKNFELNVLVDATANRDIILNGAGQYEFQQFEQGYGQVFEQHLNRWTPATAATATYPRLTVGQNYNNQRVSSFWVKNGDYLRLRNVELAYTFSNKLFESAKISGLRVFITGFNLLTSTGLNVDPEVISGYPNSRTFAFGASVKLF